MCFGSRGQQQTCLVVGSRSVAVNVEILRVAAELADVPQAKYVAGCYHLSPTGVLELALIQLNRSVHY